MTPKQSWPHYDPCTGIASPFIVRKHRLRNTSFSKVMPGANVLNPSPELIHKFLFSFYKLRLDAAILSAPPSFVLVIHIPSSVSILTLRYRFNWHPTWLQVADWKGSCIRRLVLRPAVAKRISIVAQSIENAFYFTHPASDIR